MIAVKDESHAEWGCLICYECDGDLQHEGPHDCGHDDADHILPSRWIKQTILTTDKDWFVKGLIPGNCQQAAMASLLNVSLDDVPHFAAAAPEENIPEGWSMFRDIRLWLRANNDADYAWTDDEAIYKMLREAAPQWFEPYGLAVGHTVRSESLHVVVWNFATWEMMHDPHPDNTGLTEIVQVEWLTPPYDPDPHTQIEQWVIHQNEVRIQNAQDGRIA